MPRRRKTYKQLALPYDAADLRQPLRPVLPQGLRELQHADGLSDEQARQLAQAATTIRGHKPITVDEWRELCDVVTRYVGWEEPSHAD